MKSGTFSVILNNSEYKRFRFKGHNDDDLLKIINYNSRYNHNGELNLINIFSCNEGKHHFGNIYVKNYYYNDTEIKNFLIEYKKDLQLKNEYIPIWLLKNDFSNLKYYFIENFGNIELFDTIDDMFNNKGSIWDIDTENKLWMFIKSMLKAIKFLHKLNICHFDIKPENIMVTDNSNFINKFKIIDFGFAEKYPFSNYRKIRCGTDYYLPFFDKDIDKYSEWVPIDNLTNINDWIKYDKYYHFVDIYNKSIDLVYKSDIYSLGMTFKHLTFYTKKKLDKEYLLINTLIKNMIYYNIEKRYDIDQCLQYLNLEDLDESKGSLCFKFYNLFK